MADLEDLVTVVTSVGTEHQAIEIGEELIERRLATCVNILPCMRSIYRWKGDRVCHDTELLLLIKTPKSRAKAVEAMILELHSYELPEVFTVPDEQVEDVTHRWVIDMVQGPGQVG